ncbi:MAG: tetratricopeptide repeat protein [Acidobacteriia bacterium]|nr:tetratricopeptide repeat protein [Terriglobia bacterium]
MWNRVVGAVLVAFALGLSPGSVVMGQEPRKEFTEKELIRLIKASQSDLKSVAVAVEDRGVDFDSNPKIEKRLRKAGADRETIEAVREAGPTSRANARGILTGATGTQIQVSREESKAFQAIQNEADPTRRIQLASDFEKRFPTSAILSHVDAQLAIAYHELGDPNHALEYGEKALKSDPDNLTVLIVVALTACQPGMLRGSASESAARLAESESDAGRALTLLEKMTKPPDETDEQFQARKGKLAAEAHFALGMVALMQENPAKAIEEFQGAITATPTPLPQHYFRLGEAYADSGKTGEAIEAFSKARELGKGTVIEQLANQRIAELKTLKP